MIIFYIIITILVVALFILSEDKTKLLNNLGIASIVSGIFLLVIGFVLRILIDIFINEFNIAKVSLLIFNKFLYTSIFSSLLGIISIIISKLIIFSRKITNVS